MNDSEKYVLDEFKKKMGTDYPKLNDEYYSIIILVSAGLGCDLQDCSSFRMTHIPNINYVGQKKIDSYPLGTLSSLPNNTIIYIDPNKAWGDRNIEIDTVISE